MTPFPVHKGACQARTYTSSLTCHSQPWTVSTLPDPRNTLCLKRFPFGFCFCFVLFCCARVSWYWQIIFHLETRKGEKERRSLEPGFSLLLLFFLGSLYIKLGWFIRFTHSKPGLIIYFPRYKKWQPSFINRKSQPFYTNKLRLYKEDKVNVTLLVKLLMLRGRHGERKSRLCSRPCWQLCSRPSNPPFSAPRSSNCTSSSGSVRALIH